jgi:bifunctional ADP-heptose synthase (sugar kinase/adenylyltransferase)
MAANAARKLSMAEVRLCSIIGDDQDGIDLRSALDSAGVWDSWVGTYPKRTTAKNRYYVRGKLAFRVDEEDTTPYEPQVSINFTEGLMRELSWKPHAILVSDYDKGLICERVAQTLIQYGLDQNVPVVVDGCSRRNPLLYRGAGILRLDTEDLEDMRVRTGSRDVESFMARHNIGHILECTDYTFALHSVGADYIAYDTSPIGGNTPLGAGDIVSAALTWALSTGASLTAAVRQAQDVVRNAG